MNVVQAYDALKEADPEEPHGLRLCSALLEAVIELEHRVEDLEAELRAFRAEKKD